MAVVSGTIGAYTKNLLYTKSGAQTPYTIPFGFPDVFAGPLSELIYTNGTGSLQFDLMYCPDPITLASTTQTFDLSSLTDPGGVAANFARVREIMIYNPTASAGFDLSIYEGASNPWAFVPTSAKPQYARYGGGLWRLSDPKSTGAGNGHIADGTHKTIKVDSGTHTVTFWILILGGSAA